MTKKTTLEKTFDLGNGFHAHLGGDGRILITGVWAEDTLLLEKESVDRLRRIMEEINQ